MTLVHDLGREFRVMRAVQHFKPILPLRQLVRWGHVRVHHQPHHVVHHIRKQPLDEFVRDAEVGVGVALDEPSAEVLIDEEVEAEEFEGVLALVLQERLLCAEDGVNDQIPHPGDEVLPHIYIMLRPLLIEVGLELLETQGVPVLELPVIVSVLLEAVIGKMHIVILIIHVVAKGRGPQVAVFIHENVDIRGHYHPHADIEFPPLVQEWLLDIFLRHPLRVVRLVVHQTLEFLERPEDLDASSAVQIGRLQQP